MIIKAKWGGQCRECDREIHVGDSIEWEQDEGATHKSCAAGEPPPEDRRVGSAATAKTMALPHYDEDESAIDWNSYRPRDPR